MHSGLPQAECTTTACWSSSAKRSGSIGTIDKKEHASLYKLDSLSEDVKGLFSQMLLLCARPPTLLMRDRASHLGVRILGPRDLPMLEEQLRRWLAGP